MEPISNFFDTSSHASRYSIKSSFDCSLTLSPLKWQARKSCCSYRADGPPSLTIARSIACIMLACWRILNLGNHIIEPLILCIFIKCLTWSAFNWLVFGSYGLGLIYLGPPERVKQNHAFNQAVSSHILFLRNLYWIIMYVSFLFG